MPEAARFTVSRDERAHSPSDECRYQKKRPPGGEKGKECGKEWQSQQAPQRDGPTVRSKEVDGIPYRKERQSEKRNASPTESSDLVARSSCSIEETGANNGSCKGVRRSCGD